MPAQFESWVRKGEDLVNEAKTYATPLEWEVNGTPDKTGKPKKYTVRFGSNIPGRFKCTCPDFTIRRTMDGIGLTKCKHLVRSELLLKLACEGDTQALAHIGRSARVYYLGEDDT